MATGPLPLLALCGFTDDQGDALSALWEDSIVRACSWEGGLLNHPSIHAGMVPHPADQTIAAVNAAIPGFPWAPGDRDRLTMLASLLHAALPAAAQGHGIALSMVPGPQGSSTSSSTGATDDRDEDSRNQGVALKCWRDLGKRDGVERLPAVSQRLRDKDVATFHQQAVSGMRFRHLVPIMKVETEVKAAMRATQKLSLGAGATLSITEGKEDAAPAALVGHILTNFETLLTGMDAAFTIVIPTEDNGGPPGHDGFKAASGSTTIHRWFGLSWKVTLQRRATVCSTQVAPRDLPAALMKAMTKLVDTLGSGESIHLDAAARRVSDDPTAWVPDETTGRNRDERTSEKVPLRSGNCYEWTAHGTCPDGNRCPFRQSHTKALKGGPRSGGKRYGDRDRARDRDRDQDRRSDDRRDDDRRYDDRRYDDRHGSGGGDRRHGGHGGSGGNERRGR